MKEYTLEEVSLHDSDEDAWIIIENKVYDITHFLSSHPGGKVVLLQLAGTDATEFFNELHRPGILEEYADQYKIGIIS